MFVKHPKDFDTSWVGKKSCRCCWNTAASCCVEVMHAQGTMLVSAAMATRCHAAPRSINKQDCLHTYDA